MKTSEATDRDPVTEEERRLFDEDPRIQAAVRGMEDAVREDSVLREQGARRIQEAAWAAEDARSAALRRIRGIPEDFDRMDRVLIRVDGRQVHGDVEEVTSEAVYVQPTRFEGENPVEPWRVPHAEASERLEKRHDR